MTWRMDNTPESGKFKVWGQNSEAAGHIASQYTHLSRKEQKRNHDKIATILFGHFQKCMELTEQKFGRTIKLNAW